MINKKKDKLKIAVIIRNFVTTGGAERYAYEVTKRLTDLCDVHVFCQTFDDTIGKGLVFHKIPTICSRPSFVNQLLFSLFTSMALDNSYDVIHSHERVIRFDVLTIHCPCFRGYITKTKKGWRRALVWLGTIISLRSIGYLWLEKQQFNVLRRNKIFIAVSDNVKKDVQSNYTVPDSLFAKAYSGVETVDIEDPSLHKKAMLCREKLGISKDNTVLLFVGTEFKRKGLYFLLQGLSLVNNRDVKLVVVGDGDIDHYKKLANKLGLINQVLFTGLVKNVFAYYLMADIFIMPTLSDPGPMSALEAMFCGLPVIMSHRKYCGSAEHIRHGEALLLVEPCQPELIKQAIIEMLNRQFRDIIAKKGQKIAQQLTWEKTTEKTLDAYRLITKSGSTPNSV